MLRKKLDPKPRPRHRVVVLLTTVSRQSFSLLNISLNPSRRTSYQDATSDHAYSLFMLHQFPFAHGRSFPSRSGPPACPKMCSIREILRAKKGRLNSLGFGEDVPKSSMILSYLSRITLNKDTSIRISKIAGR